MGTSIGLQFHLQIDFKIREFEAYKLKRTKEVVMTFNSTAHFTGKVTKVKTDLLKVPAMVSSRPLPPALSPGSVLPKLGCNWDPQRGFENRLAPP